MARYTAFVTISAELIQSLRLCPPQHMKAGDVLKLTTFAISGDAGMFPSKLKIRDRQRPLAGEVYRLHAESEAAVDFIDAGTGKKCRSRDNLMVRLYPHDAGEVKDLKGELRFTIGPKGAEPIINPQPAFIAKIEGVNENGVWWIATPGSRYDIRWEGQQDKVLFSGNVVVMLGSLPEREVTGAVAIDIANRITVYDRRKDRVSSFARAEHIRRTIGNNGNARSFEFINLRDVLPGEVVQAGGPQRVLNGEGLKTLEEVQ